MVFKEEDKEKLMEGSKVSRPLFNLRWGNQKVMRCLNVNSNGVAAPMMMMPTSNRRSAVEIQLSGQRDESELQRGGSTDRFKGCRSLPSPVRPDDRSLNGIEVFKKEVLSDFQSAVHNKKVVFREGLVKESEEGDTPPVKRPTAEIDGGAFRRWNLRTRNGGGNNVEGGRISNVEVSRKPNASRSSNSSEGGKKRKRAKFSCSLTHSEIEQDYFRLTGKRLPRRTQKRPTHVQEALQGLFPAMWLTDVRPDDYEVPELPKNLKVNQKIKIKSDDYKTPELAENVKVNRKIKIKLRK